MQYTYTDHYKICNNVLENICSGADMHEVNIEPFLGEDRRVKLAVVRKLDKDGYIRRVHPQTQPFIVSVTVEGYQFWVDGGYKEHFKELRENYFFDKSIKANTLIQGIIAIIVSFFISFSACYQIKTYNLESSQVKKNDTAGYNVMRMNTEISKMKTEIDSLNVKISRLVFPVDTGR